MKNYYKIFGLNVKWYRYQEGYTQLELAELLNISDVFLSNIEKGKATPSFDLLLLIAETLKTTPDNLFNIENIKKANTLPLRVDTYKKQNN